jgi:3'(2'), 5'-bisphosphate nucleotidase
VIAHHQGRPVAALDPAGYADLIENLTAISVSGALAIRQASQDANTRLKADGSPVTAADEAAEAVIRDGVARLMPPIPMISEERAERDQPLAGGASVILVDPLDGTRDFIAGRDEYTINIALVTGGIPVLGVITAPALGLIWRGIVGRGSERLEFDDDGKVSQARTIHTQSAPEGKLVVVVSRSHIETRTRAYLDGLADATVVPCGSAVKFCRIAEGGADHYPRLAPTRDWDVAAGHAILEAAGGCVVAPDGGRIVYGSPELRIPGFLAWGEPKCATRIRG